jgi:signal transduction histidine kinase
VIRFTLRRKFLAAFVGLAVIFAASFGALAFYSLERTLVEQVRIRAKLVTEDLAREASQFLHTPEGQTRTPTSSRLTRRLVAGAVLYAQIYQRDELKFTDGRQALAVPAPAPARPLVVVRRVTPDGMPYLDLSRAIPEFTLDSRTYVRVGFPLADVYARLREEVKRIAIACALFILSGVLAAFLLHRTILGPVERTIDAIREMRRGDLSVRVQPRTSDELRALADEFNAMAGTLQVRERELARVNEALRKANRIKDEFSASMSHELKTPLHAIRAYAQLLLEGIDGPLTEPQRQDVEALLAAGDHLLHLIEGILRYSALEAGQAMPVIADVNVAEVVEQARKNVAHLARSKGLPIEAAVDGGLVVRADETMLRQVLINLLHNAIKYTKRGAITVRVAAAQEAAGRVVLSVSDTGPGIPEGYEHEVFEPFRRAGQAGRPEIDGIGLGLAVAKRYIEQQGGTIWFESAHGRGTTFFVALPSTEEAPVALARP